MFKDMHRPIEEDDEVAGDAKALSAVASNQATIDALLQKMDAILEAQAQQQTLNGFYPPRSLRNRPPRVDAVVNSGSPTPGNGFTVGFRLEESVWGLISVPTMESPSVGGVIFSDVLAKRVGASV
ncbi:LOW QUALITY PROTEIN: hypothetical protein PHMEG_000513 [Phytophthora megakarya]|uniref:Uncharacterized protein n=1 Tax=Phytophthora megakarya TaxID=4795 RepID=A0A225X437_9STRA|nr:LOW QUALITY PROTEIN: hypothetical protein PHMEG_000513 [Phytophthora megakarya]